MPFLYRSLIALLHFRKFNVEKSIQENGWHKLENWYKVSLCTAYGKNQ